MIIRFICCSNRRFTSYLSVVILIFHCIAPTKAFISPLMMKIDLAGLRTLQTRPNLVEDDDGSTASHTNSEGSLSLSEYLGSARQNEACTVYGHRGCVYEECENTLAGFTKAAEFGARGVELDVFKLTDGILVCYHGTGTDQSPGRMKESHGVDTGIEALAWPELEEMDVSLDWEEGVCGSDKLRGAKVPKLGDALDLCKKLGLGVKIELKGDGVEDDVVSMIQSQELTSHVEISSFDHAKLARVHSLDPSISTGALFSSPCPPDFVERSKNVHASEVHLRYDTCSAARVREAKEADLKVMAWFRGPLSMKQDSSSFVDCDNEDEKMYKIVMASGCDMVCVNRPDVAIGVVDK